MASDILGLMSTTGLSQLMRTRLRRVGAGVAAGQIGEGGTFHVGPRARACETDGYEASYIENRKAIVQDQTRMG